ncbi:MAG: hypothetical protein QM775_26365 [Pirellulales bacterium]
MGRGMLAGHGGHLGGLGGHYSEGPTPAPQDPTPPAFSRFHPVPTRPVFEPQGLAYGEEMHAPPVPRVESLPQPQGSSSRRPAPDGSSSLTSAPAMIAAADDAGVESATQYDVRPVVYEEPAIVEEPAAVSVRQEIAAKPQKNSVTWKVAQHRA